MQRSERQLHLGFDPSRPPHLEPDRLLGRVAEERCLAYSGFTADDEDCAMAVPGFSQESVERFTLVRTPKKQGLVMHLRHVMRPQTGRRAMASLHRARSYA